MGINKDYKKISLREFRHNFTQLKNSLSKGEVYQVTDRGNAVGYFIPADYEVEIKAKRLIDAKEFMDRFLTFSNAFEFRDEVKDAKSAKEAYHRLLDLKYKKYIKK